MPAGGDRSSIEALLTRLTACGLLSQADHTSLRDWAARVPDTDPQALVRELLRRSAVTRWQLSELQSGRSRFLLDDGRYLLERPLGQGGMGTVYLALHRRLRKHVAVKMLNPRLTGDPQQVARFEREMRVVGRLAHPHIVQATDAGEFDGERYLVMEYIDGGSLSEVLATAGRLRISDACEIVRQAALGLQHVADQGLVHRDLKPSNLMLTRAGVVKVADLGLALLHGESQFDGAAAESLTTSGQVMGTYDYMAPEQTRGAHSIDIRADIYSLGCTLFTLLTGSTVFPSARYPTAFDKINAHRDAPPPELAEWLPDCPPELGHLMKQLLAKQPEDRPLSPASVARQLAPLSHGHNLAALARAQFPSTDPELPVDGLGTTVVPIEIRSTFVAGRSAERWRPVDSRRDRKAFWKWAAVALIAVVGVSLGLNRGQRNGTPEDHHRPNDVTAKPPTPRVPDSSPDDAWLRLPASLTLDTAIADSRVAAPDYADRQPVVAADFSTSQVMLQKYTATESLRHGVDRYLMTVQPTRNFNAPCPGGPLASPAYRVIGRASAGHGSWFVDIYRSVKTPTEKSWAIRISIEPGSQLRVSRAYWQTEPGVGPVSGPIRHAAIRPVNEWNDLLAVIRYGALELYVNGIAVCAPLPIAPENIPALLAIGAQAPNAAFEQAEFLSVESWDASGWPRPSLASSSLPLVSVETRLRSAEQFVRLPSQVHPDRELTATPVDLSLTAAAYVEDFDAPHSDELLQNRWSNIEYFWENGYWTAATSQVGGLVWYSPWKASDMVVEVTARSRATGISPHPLKNGWSLSFQQTGDYKTNRGFAVGINRSGQWSVSPVSMVTMNCPTLSETSHPAIRPGSQWNTLRVEIRGRYVAVFINGTAVCHPFELGFVPGELQTGLQFLHLTEGETDFDRLVVWTGEDAFSEPRPTQSGIAFDAEREREAAAWVLSKLGKVRVQLEAGEVLVTDAHGLPVLPFRIKAIDLTDASGIDDSALAQLAGLSSLESLNLERCNVTGTGFKDVPGLDSLDWLELHFNPVNAAGLQEIAKLQTITHLGLRGCPVSDSDLAPLQGLPCLRALGLAETPITDDAVIAVAGIPSLVELYIEFTTVTGATLDRLAACPSLEKLHLYATPFSSEHAHRLEGLAELRMLALDRTNLSGAALSSIGRLPQLEFLGLGRLPIDDEDLDLLKPCHELRSLWLWESNITDEGIAHLAAFPHLHTLGLNNTSISELGLMEIAKLTSLRELEATLPAIPKVAWDRFEQLRPSVLVTR